MVSYQVRMLHETLGDTKDDKSKGDLLVNGAPANRTLHSTYFPRFLASFLNKSMLGNKIIMRDHGSFRKAGCPTTE